MWVYLNDNFAGLQRRIYSSDTEGVVFLAHGTGIWSDFSQFTLQQNGYVRTVEHDFWQTIHAFEHALTEERGKTTRLARTRQKVARVGVLKTLEDWALSNKETDGFKMLLERGMPDLSCPGF